MGNLRRTLAAAVVTATLAGGVNEGLAQTQQSKLDPSKDTTEMTAKNLMVGFQESQADIQSDSVVDWNSANQGYEETKGEGGLGVEPDLDGDETQKDDGGDSKEKPENKSPVEIHGMVRIGTQLIPDFFDITSPDCAMIAVGDATNNETGLGVTIVRTDNFKRDTINTFSQATVINPHRSKDFGRAHIGVECKYNFIDKAPEFNSFTPDIVGSYSTDNGWTFEGVYTHKFQNGEDADAFRLGITKKINDKFKATVQTLYDTGYEKKVAGNIIIDCDLGNGFGFQCGCVCKNGVHPQLGVIYQR